MNYLGLKFCHVGRVNIAEAMSHSLTVGKSVIRIYDDNDSSH